jgi:hypothetical protein
MVVTCPHCKILIDTDQAAYVDDDLILCEHCGNEFMAPPDPRRTAAAPPAPAAVPEPPPAPPRIVISADEMPGHPPIEHSGKRGAHAAHTVSAVATFSWSLGILVLLVLLAGQFGYFMRDDLARYPPLRPWIEKLCAYAGCRVPLLHAPGQMRVLARDVRRHPTAADGLLVSVTFSNQASYRQAYPLIQLTFLDMRDRIAARRSFAPEDYLSRDADIAAGIPAGAAVQATIEIVDPGANAVNFTLEFY